MLLLDLFYLIYLFTTLFFYFYGRYYSSTIPFLREFWLGIHYFGSFAVFSSCAIVLTLQFVREPTILT